MVSLERVDGAGLHHVDAVVEQVLAATGAAPDRLMLVGAEARDALHHAQGHEWSLNATRDIDLGLGVDGWDEFDAVRSTFRAGSDSGVCFEIEGHRVDVIPFGRIENPAGYVRPVTTLRNLGVQAFREVFDAAIPLRLPSGTTIRIPTPVGYCALKVFAWLDRSADHDTKDGRDLAVVTWWYAHSRDVEERLYSDPELRLLTEHEWDMTLAAAALLGEDVATLVGSAHFTELHRRWKAMDRRLLARNLAVPPKPRWRASLDERQQLVAALGASW